jgi:hypothetical protein
MTSIDDLRKLRDQLEECAQRGSDAQLSRHSTELLLAVIRAGNNEDGAALQAIVEPVFQIVAGGAEGKSEEILGGASDAAIARAMFDEAAKQKPDQKIRLKKGSEVLART